MDGEFGRAVRDQLEDHVAVEAHALGALAHVGAMRLHDAARLVMQHVDADFLQHAQRGEVDRFQLVVGDQLGRRERDSQLPERRLLEGGRAAGALSGASAAAGAVSGHDRFGGLKGGGHDGPHGNAIVRIMDRRRPPHCGGDDH